jgi:long-subunit fatty acid transport protein
MLLFLSLAAAASLDNLEIGGPWGSPTSTDGTSGWWNPAGFAVGKGTRLDLELAYEDAQITFDRADPNGGDDVYTLSGLPPYLGAAADVGKLGPGNLGVGLVFALPFIRGGTETTPPGSGHYHMIDGDSKAMWIGAGVAYDVQDIISFGVTGAVVHSTWAAEVDQDTMPDLYAAVKKQGGQATADALGYTEDGLENPDYAAHLDFGGESGGLSGKGELTGDAFSFAAGVLVHPSDRFAIGVTYVHGAVIENTGDVVIDFACPPDTDGIGRAIASSHGVCNTTVRGDGYVGYTLPRRVHGGVMFKPVDPLRLEVMGGWVRWSEYSDFHIKVSNTDVTGANDTATAEAKDLVEQTRDWARENEDTFWVALDGKVKVGKQWTFGGRYWFDHHAVPDEALSTNNWDADEHIVSGLVAFKPVKFFEVGLSFTQHFVGERVIDNSGFANPLDVEAVADRWRYPQSNGTYNGSISRVGLQLKGTFGGEKGAAKGKKGKG